MLLNLLAVPVLELNLSVSKVLKVLPTLTYWFYNTFNLTMTQPLR